MARPFGVNYVQVDWPGAELPVSNASEFTVFGRYWLDAINFLGATRVNVYRTTPVRVSYARPNMNPIVMCAAGSSTIREARRVATIMPIRM